MIEDIEDNAPNTISLKLFPFYKRAVEMFLTEGKIKDYNDYKNRIHKIRRAMKIQLSKVIILEIWKNHLEDKFNLDQEDIDFLTKCRNRGNIGVSVITVMTTPLNSCMYDCDYCALIESPEENGDLLKAEPRSYFEEEQIDMRANRTSSERIVNKRKIKHYNLDLQAEDRINGLIKTGNITDPNFVKAEVIISGGTWHSYKPYQRLEFMLRLYWGCNTYATLEEKENPNYKQREPFYFSNDLNDQLLEKISIDDNDIPEYIIEAMKTSLRVEIIKNETARIRIVGLTPETRPDQITFKSVKELLDQGVTRVQLGIQTDNDAVLKLVNRECYTKDSIRAIKLLKRAGLKVVIHIMPDLPGATFEDDMRMVKRIATDSDFDFDEVKVYPTIPVKNSKIYKKFDSGEWKPYSVSGVNGKNYSKLVDVVLQFKRHISPHIRIQRMFRDIPKFIHHPNYHVPPNLRQIVKDQMNKHNEKCPCIRCLEPRNKNVGGNAKYIVRHHIGSDGDEYYISLESCTCSKYWCNMKKIKIKGRYYNNGCKNRNCVYGFLRLRLDPEMGYKSAAKRNQIHEIIGHAMIRELHVYGKNASPNQKTNVQHHGYGKHLVSLAEEISYNSGYQNIAVISGVGVREYYKTKCGYHKSGNYMVKDLTKNYNLLTLVIIIFSILVYFIVNNVKIIY